MVEVQPFYGDVAPETCLRLHDAAMIEWLGQLQVRKQFAKVVPGWQSRAHAQTHQVHEGKPVKQAIPLPMVTLTGTGLKIDGARWTRNPVRMTRYGPASRENVIYRGELAYHNEVAWTGNGTTKSFISYDPLSQLPVRPGLVTLTFTIGGVIYSETDLGNGYFTNKSHKLDLAFVDYLTGVYRAVFSVAPDNDTSVTFKYASQDSDNRAEVIHTAFPLPIMISYQVDLWTKTQQDMRVLRTGILVQFDPYLTWLAVEFPQYGKKIIYLEITGDTDNSNLETDEEERELRHTFNIDMHGWIFRQPYAVKSILSRHIVFIAAGGGPPPNCQLNDQGFLDWYDDSTHYHLSADGSQIDSIDESPDYTPPARVITTLSFGEDGSMNVGP